MDLDDFSPEDPNDLDCHAPWCDEPATTISPVYGEGIIELRPNCEKHASMHTNLNPEEVEESREITDNEVVFVEEPSRDS